ncbi:M20 metallopeptidase family protein [Parasutterella excrementihominis]|jgi:hippurate hydrolase|uniref:M20 metallopeptidase family protein n=1 Tax=Parasutterella excrementihominis TaxID=487175 RepID=UPI00248CB2F1|nr:amidohydrolase [Parasutterella excrementihominis]
MPIIIKASQLEESAKLGAQFRHCIHEEPEIGLYLPKTQEKIVNALKSFGIKEISTFVGGANVTGVVAVIEGSRPGKTIGLRADSDALPLEEKTGVEWSSKVPMAMHACGHDGHVGTLLAAVHYINQHRDFAGRLVAIFQPGEEGFAGGRYMIEDGLVQKFGIDEFYALHAEPMLPVGCVGFIPGFATANADIFKITFTGVGGHGSRPHLTRDPLVAACECVLSLQTIVSRSVDPNQTAVVSAGCISCGNEKGSSVVQKTATIVGTTRSFEKEVQDIIIQRMQQIVDGTALSNDMKGKLEYTKLYPAMFNSPEHVEKAKALLEEALGLDKVKLMIRRAGGEDFSFMLQAKPGCLFRLGVQDETHNASVHNPEFDFNDKAIATGAACLLTIALNRAAS